MRPGIKTQVLMDTSWNHFLCTTLGTQHPDQPSTAPQSSHPPAAPSVLLRLSLLAFPTPFPCPFSLPKKHREIGFRSLHRLRSMVQPPQKRKCQRAGSHGNPSSSSQHTQPHTNHPSITEGLVVAPNSPGFHSWALPQWTLPLHLESLLPSPPTYLIFSSL